MSKPKATAVEGISSVLPGFILAPIPDRIKRSVPGTGGVVVSAGAGEACKRAQVLIRNCHRSDRWEELASPFGGWLHAAGGGCCSRGTATLSCRVYDQE